MNKAGFGHTEKLNSEQIFLWGVLDCSEVLFIVHIAGYSKPFPYILAKTG